jgi:hypothetical protein
VGLRGTFSAQPPDLLWAARPQIFCDAAGFDIIELRFDSGAFNFVRSVKYMLEEKRDWSPPWLRRIDWPSNKLIRRTLKHFFFVIDRMRLGDVMVAILRKDHSPEAR